MGELNDKLLYKIDSPSDLKQLDINELEIYCQQLRQYIIDECATNPGHLASSLGVVELTTALHYIYNSPEDKIIWDVGHQTYPHKIITGRRDLFPNKRRRGGISGFPRMSESEHDVFGAGHSSVSISAAFGMAKAAELKGEPSRVVAIIGDGAMTGGLAFEGLNNGGASPTTDMLVILNDNHMSIDKATGALNRYLLHISTSKRYNRFKQWAWKHMSHTPKLLRLVQLMGNGIKQGLLRRSNLFESFNYRYFGPVDGHDLPSMTRVLASLRDIEGPKLLHVLTDKGKGYAPAENNQRVWHAPGKYDPVTGERIKSANSKDRFQDVFGQTLLEIAQADERVVGITPAMLSGSSMDLLQQHIPQRCFDVGIAEGHAVTYSAGLAAAGMVPFCNIYSSFMQRAYDNVIHDVAIQNLHVVMCLDRAGLVGEDGATHHGAFDMAYFSTVPNLIVMAPSNEMELRNAIWTAYKGSAPTVIRYPRGEGDGTAWRGIEPEIIPIGKAQKLRDGNRIAVLTIGATAHNAKLAIDSLGDDAQEVAHFDMRFAKPLDTELLHSVAAQYDHVITIEDGSLRGGVGEAIAALFADNNYTTKITRLGIPDKFIEHGTVAELQAECGFDMASIAGLLRSILA